MVLQREREAREEKSRAEWEAKFGRPYTASCVASYNLTDYCREQFGLPKRQRSGAEDGLTVIPEPYRRAVRPKRRAMLSDYIGMIMIKSCSIRTSMEFAARYSTDL